MTGGPAWTRLMWEFVLVLAFVQDATAQFILGTALNHAPATFFSLLAMLFFVRGVPTGRPHKRGSFLERTSASPWQA